MHCSTARVCQQLFEIARGNNFQRFRGQPQMQFKRTSILAARRRKVEETTFVNNYSGKPMIHNDYSTKNSHNARDETRGCGDIGGGVTM